MAHIVRHSYLTCKILSWFKKRKGATFTYFVCLLRIWRNLLRVIHSSALLGVNASRSRRSSLRPKGTSKSYISLYQSSSMNGMTLLKTPIISFSEYQLELKGLTDVSAILRYRSLPYLTPYGSSGTSPCFPIPVPGKLRMHIKAHISLAILPLITVGSSISIRPTRKGK